MTDVSYQQQIQIISTNNLTPASQVDFQIFPAEVFTTTLYNESIAGRYNVPASATDVVQSMGTVATGSLFIITPFADIEVAFTNGAGTSPPLYFYGGRTSVLNLQFTGFSFTNPSAVVIKGRYYVLGI